MNKPKLNITKSIKRPGSLSAKAKNADLTVNQYATKHKGDSNLTGQQSRFYLNTLKPIHKKKSP